MILKDIHNPSKVEFVWWIIPHFPLKIETIFRHSSNAIKNVFKPKSGNESKELLVRGSISLASSISIQRFNKFYLF